MGFMGFSFTKVWFYAIFKRVQILYKICSRKWFFSNKEPILTSRNFELCKHSSFLIIGGIGFKNP